jgi:hypothetical protein
MGSTQAHIPFSPDKLQHPMHPQLPELYSLEHHTGTLWSWCSHSSMGINRPYLQLYAQCVSVPNQEHKR